MTKDEQKKIIKEYDEEFEKYKFFLYDEYKRADMMDYKNILMTSILNRSLALIEASPS